MNETKKYTERILGKAERSEDGCFLWTQATNKAGYPVVSLDGKLKVAHRVILEERDGAAPPHHVAGRSCKVNHCVNPDHLSWIPRAVAYRFDPAKGPRGNTRMRPEHVHEIRDRIKAGERQKDIAESVGVTQSAINAIAQNKTWAYIHGEERLARTNRSPKMSKREVVQWILDNAIPHENGCRLWHMATMPNGYGHLAYKGKMVYPHKLVCEHFHGPAPKGHVAVLTCRQRNCVNPDHVLWVSRSDACRIYRRPRKDLVLSEEQARDAKRRMAAGESNGSIATAYGVHETTISNIRTGRSWAWVVP